MEDKRKMRKLGITLVVLMLMSLFAVGAASANNNDDYVDELELRGPIWNFSALDNDVDQLVANETNFAGFWYDLDEDRASENLTVLDVDGDTIKEEDLVYTATPQKVTTSHNFTTADDEDWGDYPLLGFLAEEYVPVFEDGPLVYEKDELAAYDVDKLSRLLLDTDDSWTLRVGETLELEEGYAIEPQQIDVDGDKVWLELTKDGEYIDDEIIDVGNDNETSWVYDQTVMGEEDVVTLAVDVDQVFQGTVDALVVIEGAWQIADDGTEIETDDTFGKMEVDSVEDEIVMELESDITLRSDTKQHIMEDLYFRVAEYSSGEDENKRFYLMQEITEPGTYEVRGTVANEDDWGTTTQHLNWTATGDNVTDGDGDSVLNATEGFSFAGFYYDLNEDMHSEWLQVRVGHLDGDRTLDDDGDHVNYSTHIQYPTEPEFEFEYDGDQFNYSKIGFFAEEYVPVFSENDAETGSEVGKLSKLLMDTDDSWTLRVGQTLDLEEGYAIEPQQIDVDGEKVWLELTKDGEFVDDQIIEADGDYWHKRPDGVARDKAKDRWCNKNNYNIEHIWGSDIKEDAEKYVKRAIRKYQTNESKVVSL